MPLPVHKEGILYRDGVDISPSDIFDLVDSGGALCTTSAPNAQEYCEMFEKLSAQYDAIIHISLGSGFSSSYENAHTAARSFDNVRVIDSQNLSTGQGLVVLSACDMAKSGTDVDDICAALRELTRRVEASFLINRLDYLTKGGRCSTIQQLGANLLSLKPCIEVVNGCMQVKKKYRGSLVRCIRAYVKERLGSRDDIERDRLFLTHTSVSDNVIQTTLDVIRETPEFQWFYETNAGCTISCHCGPGALGVLFIRKPV